MKRLKSFKNSKMLKDGFFNLSEKNKDLLKSDETENDSIFKKLFICVIAVTLFYIFFYLLIKIRMTAYALLFGFFLFTPAILFLNFRGYKLQSKLLFILFCNYSIFSTSMTLGHLVNAEYYCFPSMMFGLILFQLKEKKNIVFAIIYSFLTWVFISTKVSFINLNQSYINEVHNYNLEKINAVGAFTLMLLFLSIYIRASIRKYKNQLKFAEEVQKSIKSEYEEKIKNEFKFQIILESMQEGLLIVNDLGHYVQCNRAALNILNMNESEILNKEVQNIGFKFIKEDGSPYLNENLPSRLSLNEGRTIRDCIVGIQKEEKPIKWIKMNTSPFYFNLSTNIENKPYVICTFSDFTEQKRIQSETIERKIFLEAVLDHIPSMVFVKDFKNDFKISLLNKAGEKIFGATNDQVLGKNDYDFFPKEQADFFTGKDREVFHYKKTVVIEKEDIKTPYGERVLKTIKVPSFDSNGNPHLLIGISNDITDEINAKKELELERQKSIHHSKLAMLGEMSAGIAHEINNPLAVISGSLNLLERLKDQPEKYHEKIQFMNRSVERISKIVKGLRKFARTGGLSEFKPINLSEMIEEVIVLTEAKSKKSSVKVETLIESNSKILCDEVEIEQVLVNLVNNALDAIKDLENKWVKIHFFEEKNEAVIRVTDSGKGLSKEIEEKIFNPFFTTKPVGEGTGLGLSICKGILDQHSATIEVNRRFENTCFEIRFKRFLEKKEAA